MTLESGVVAGPGAAGLKVCGVRRAVDYAACGALGVTSIGLNFWSGSRRRVRVDEARALIDAGPRRCELVGVFVERSPAEAAAIARTLGLDLIQPHGTTPIEAFAALGLPYVWVVRGAPALDTLTVPSPAPARVLLDAAVPGFGGAGVRTDWEWAARAVRRLSAIAPVWLAGGIRVENARQALEQVRPAGLDVASGVESRAPGHERGAKDPELIAALLDICREFCEVPSSDRRASAREGV